MHTFLIFIMINCWVTAFTRSSLGSMPYKDINYEYGRPEVIRKKTELVTKNNIVLTPQSSKQPTKSAKMHYHKNFQHKIYNYLPKPQETTHSEEHSRIIESLSTEVDEYLIKVKSVSHSKESPFEFKRSDLSGPDIHHVIEISAKEESKAKTEEFATEFLSQKSLESMITLEQTSEDSMISNTIEDGMSIEIQRETLRSEHTVTEKLEDPIESRAGNGAADELEGSGEDRFNSEDKDSDDAKGASGRLLSFLSRANDSSPFCTTPKGEPGRCRRFRQCMLLDALENFNNFLQYLCLVRGISVGVCCPDNPVIEISNPDNSTDFNSTVEITQPPEGCGLNVKTRIVGGTISVPHEWSWTVALMRRNRFYCGGVVINNWYILTAAHCVLGINVKDLTVRLGEYNFTTKKEHEEDLSVSEIKRHAQFVTVTFQHDIALLKLKRSIRYSKFVGSICLPDQKARDYSDVDATVVGWGTVSFGGAASPVLRQVTIPVWKNADCDRAYVLESIGESFMCAGSPEKGEDACQGDSGGPLMTLNARGRWEVIGLVSWGRRCGDPTYPGVYTRVTTYLDWIEKNAV